MTNTKWYFPNERRNDWEKLNEEYPELMKVNNLF